MYRLFISTLFIVLVAASAPAGAQSNYPARDSLPDSEIDIPIRINLRPFYALAEKNVDTVFTSPNYPQGWVQPDCMTRYKYRFRRSPLRISAAGTSMYLGFTGFYQITGSSRACMNGTVLSPWTPECACGIKEGERRVNIGFGASFNLQPNYILKTQIVRPEPKPLDKCTVCFWGQDITTTVLDGLKAELDASRKAMEDSFSNINLRPYIQQAWNSLSTVYNIPGAGYFALQPKKLRMENIGIRNDLLSISIGITASPVIRLVKPDGQLSPVPDLTRANNPGGFNVHLEAALQYDSLSQVLNGYLMHKRFEVSEGLINKHIVIEDAKVSGDSSGNLLIRLAFSGSFTGTVDFAGKPVYDPVKRSIDVENLEYDLQTKSFLLKTAKWLFNKKILNEMRTYTSFSLSGYYDSAAKTINEWLNKEWVKGIKGSGRVSDLKLTSMAALPEHLLIRTQCLGQLEVAINEINLKF